MRVRAVYIDHTARLSGAELALTRLLPALSEVDATVVLGEEGPLVERLSRLGIDVRVVPLAGGVLRVRRGAVVPGWAAAAGALAAVKSGAALARELRRLRPDLVVTNSLKADLYGGVAARLAGVPVIWHVHDRIATDYLPRPAVRLVRLSARLLADGLIANSEATRATLPAGRAVAIGNVCPPLTPQPPPGGARLRVGLVGRIAPWKGQDVFLRALAATALDLQPVVVGAPLFGEEGYAQSLRRLAAELGLDVEWAGFLPDPAEAMAAMDIVVHCSTVPEPFGQVVVEALALGRCVVAAGAGGPAEVVTDGVDGLLTPPGDVTALAAALRRLAADPVLRHRLETAAPAAAAPFAADKIAAAEQAYYRAVLDRRR